MPDKVNVTMLYLNSCDIAQDLINETYPGITKKLLRAETPQFEEKLHDILYTFVILCIFVNCAVLLH